MGDFDRLLGQQYLDRVYLVDQSPIGRTPRSNPATYLGIFDDIRSIFAETVEAKTKGFKKGRFSFNVRGGRCEKCQGAGVIKIQMQFLPDVYVTCDVCEGHRYNKETLEVRYKGKTIYDVLNMTIDEAADFFQNHYSIAIK
jgi:excinuclease ABC subunit A